MIKICFVIPESFGKKIEAIKKLLSDEFPNINAEFLIYEDYKLAFKKIECVQTRYDTILYGGPSAYRHAQALIRQETHWDYFPRMGSTILRAIIEAVAHKWDITRLSIDVYDRSAIEEIFLECGIDVGRTKLRIFCGDSLDKDYAQQAIEFHKDSLNRCGASGCITSLSPVTYEFDRLGIPYIAAIPTLNSMRNKLLEIQQYHRARRQAFGQITVLYVNINFPPEHSVLLGDEYSFMLEKMKITKEIYRYADQIAASVSQDSLYNYVLFSTCGYVEKETNYYQNFDLLDWLQRVTVYSVSIGIGSGESVAQARHNAFRGMLKAQKHKENAAYIILSEEEPIGPFFGESRLREPKIDRHYAYIAERAGISVNTFDNFYKWYQKHELEYFTSQELADGLKINKRSADRLIEKLVDAGIVSIEGLRMNHDSGRPARVMRIRAEMLRLK
ncbi:MAG: hypothetical protein KH230_03395 [Enterocloster asparagiformis]|nr:hypothetical protein [Enterocloster asparagiformis]